MAPGGPGANSRGRGGKFKKPVRGGGKHYSRDLRPLDADGNEVSMWSVGANKKKGAAEDLDEEESEESSEEEEEEEESDSDEAGPAGKQSAAAAELSREERKKEKKARKEAALARARGQAVQVGDLPSSESESDEGPMPANPNHSRASRNQTKAPVVKKDVDEATEGVKALAVIGTPNRRERESLEAAQAKERYRKLHEAGKTDEAKADLARLKLIREKREAESARKQAEKEEREAQEAAKRAELDAKEAKKREAALGPAKGKAKGKK
ncbi:casein kinase substrate phosphoprotein PP28-domain-containing protein [Lasiosphaeria hispida]|uniref:Casein kinase substrate phosphoprotein PP28-domain-containing protein n=1 Tax=Lasiosphaeria hispida TaxID=260671 RepID=A0AAJ0HBS7_9PEZI|nr:casein kinase substrate phosphoprotein PP28-domain-containing protein [Lasiosphaeria hispida]